MPSRAEQQRMLDETIERLIAEHNEDQARRNVDTYHVSRGITGEPSNRNRNFRVTGDNWKRHHYHDTHGAIKTVAMRSPALPVTVTLADGTTTVRAASSFRKQNIATKQRKHREAVTSEVADRNAAARERLQATLQAHPIGNVE